MIDSIAIYIIHGFVVLGAVLLFFFAGPPAIRQLTDVALRAGCRPLDEKDEKSACWQLNSGEFNATNAFVEVKALTAITPRHSGSPGAQKAAEHLLSRLRATEIQSYLDEFKEETPAGQMLFRNIIGVLPGRPARRSLGAGGKADGSPADSPLRSPGRSTLASAKPLAEPGSAEPGSAPRSAIALRGGELAKRGEWIVIGAHYDTKAGISENFQGANDSGSGVGVLLELARNIKNSSNLPVNFIFAFFDGEECAVRYDKNDGLHGSRRLAEQLVKDGRSAKVRAVIILDMVGDRDLNITIPRNSALSLVSALFAAAKAEGTRERFTLWPTQILDDHAPFLLAGMPAIDIIDFEYGSAPGQNDYWHTQQDTVDKLSVQSIEMVGRTVLRLLDDLMRVKP